MKCSRCQQPLSEIPRFSQDIPDPSRKEKSSSPPILWLGCPPCNRLFVVQGDRVLEEEPLEGLESSEEPDIDFGDARALDRIAAEMLGPDPQAWQQHWEKRHLLPPHPDFVHWVETQARQVLRKRLRHRIQSEQFADASAKTSVRPILRRTQPPVARVLQEALRQGMREVIVEGKDLNQTASLKRVLKSLPQKREEGNPDPEG